MTTELDIARHDGHVEIVPARPKAGSAAAAMDMLREHAEMMSMAFELAKNMVGTTMVPRIYQRKNPKDEEAAQNATAAILYGLELGLNPIQSLQQVFSVHGQPTIYARTMVALLKSKGYKFKTIETGPERVTYSGWWPGEEPETSTWDIERATKAGFVPQIDPKTGEFARNKFDKLVGNEKYLTQPEEMLWAKAASTVCRRLAPDVLLGIGHTVEDLESEPDPEPVRVRSERMYTDRVSDAEVADAMPVTPPKVQQWQPKPTEAPAEPQQHVETASNEVEKQDTSQVDDSAEPPVEYATAAEQRTLSAELERHGHKTPAAKRKWLSADTGREITSAKELTTAEAVGIIDRLKHREAGDMPILQSQWATAAEMLDKLGADDTEKKVLFLRNFLQRNEIRDPFELNEREAAEVLAELTQVVADEAQAADAGQLPIDGAEGGEQ